VQAIKYRHDQWQSWENFGKAALDVGAHVQACRAVQKVLELSNNKRVDTNTLWRLVEWVERSTRRKLEHESRPAEISERGSGGDGSRQGESGESGGVETKETRDDGKRDLESEGQALSAADVAAAVGAIEDDVDEEESSSGQEETSKPTEEGDVASEREMGVVGELLKRVVGSGEGGGEVWGLQARFFEATGNVDMAKESRLRQVRALQVGPS
jgi:hypothetical protein